MHNFCSACLSQWLDTNEGRSCPQCRGVVEGRQRNHTLEHIVESFLKENPERRRPDAELREMDERSKLTDEMLRVSVRVKLMGLILRVLVIATLMDEMLRVSARV